MFGRTSLPISLIFITLIASGCASNSAPVVPQSAGSGPAQPTLDQPPAQDNPAFPVRTASDDAETVSNVSFQQPETWTPEPSVVRWVGPAQNPVQANVVQAPPAQPAPIADQVPPLKPDTRPALTDSGIHPTKVVNPPAQHAHVVLAEPASRPSNTVVAIAIAQAVRDKPVKVPNHVADTPVNPIAPQPSPAPLSPATRPTAPAAMIAAPKTFPQAARLFPAEPLKGISFESVLEQLPQEAQPLPNIGWDGFSIPKAHKWIRQQLAGAELQLTVEIAHVELIRIPDARDSDETAGWEIALTTKPERFRAFGIDSFHWAATWKVDASGKMWRGGDVRFPVTEDFAKQARLWRVGDTVVLSGTIEDIAIEGGTTNLGQPCGRFTTIFQDVHVDKLISQGNRQ